MIDAIYFRVIAQKRLSRGIRLNIPEAIGLLTLQILELCREGYSTAVLMDKGKRILGYRQVIPGVGDILDEVQVEGTFPDGSKLITIHNPICTENGDLSLSLYGSCLPVPDISIFKDHPEEGLIPGKVYTVEGNLTLNKGRLQTIIKVLNTGDRPVQIGSHYHFIEANPTLKFDRILSLGKRLNIPAGTAVRFEPGEMKSVCLVDISGTQEIRGGNNLCNGYLNDLIKNKVKILNDLLERGFLHQEENFELNEEDIDRNNKRAKLNEGYEISRYLYAKMFGPTTGDIIRLGDTELYVRVEKDFTVYGDECKFGGGKL